MEIRERKKRELIDILVCMGFIAELGGAIAANLRTEKPSFTIRNITSI